MNKLITPLHAAHLCKASYHNFDTLDGPVEALETLGYKLLFSLQSDFDLQTEGWALVSSEYSSRSSSPYVVLVFPGSKSLRDWILNFKAKLKGWPTASDKPPISEGNIAEGAWIEWNEVWYEVWKALRSKWNRGGYKPLPLAITGHSRGAQLAETVGLSLKQHEGNYYDLCQIERFAPPRTGDLAWCRYRNSLTGGTTRSWTHNADIVPHLPPHSKSGYWHAELSGPTGWPENFIWVQRYGPDPDQVITSNVCHSQGEYWPRIWDKIDEFSIRDHSIDEYIKALEKAVT